MGALGVRNDWRRWWNITRRASRDVGKISCCGSQTGTTEDHFTRVSSKWSIESRQTPTMNSRGAFPKDGGGEDGEEKCADGGMVVGPMRSPL